METKAFSTRNHFEGVMPLRVQFNFDIPLFEGQIDAYALWKVITLSKNFLIVKISPSCSLNPFPMSKLGGKVIGRGTLKMNLHQSGENPPGWTLYILSRRSSTMLEAMMTSI
jgi:hypothetical protein